MIFVGIKKKPPRTTPPYDSDAFSFIIPQKQSKGDETLVTLEECCHH